MAAKKRPRSRPPRRPARGASTPERVEPPAAPRASAAEVPGNGSGFDLADTEVETALVTGDHAGLLEDYFGPAEYAELTTLARTAAARSGTRGGPPVLILPGIMGSKLGRKGGLFDDVYWFDPIDVGLGKMYELKLPGGRPVVALGVILFAYLKLKLRLRAAGYAADFYAFDWRRPIPELGAELAAHLKQRAERAHLVAHSMGGLVARAAIGQGAPYGRLVMLGTPNFGSFAPVMAFRATYPVVRKVGALDLKHTPEQLARDVFASFAGLTQMLPAPERWSEVDLYDVNSWPAGDLRPREPLLRAVAAARAALPPGRGDQFMVCGVDQETTVGLRLPDPAGDFVYQRSTAGDGTVPVALAQLPGAGAHYYVAESHGSLPNNALVARVVDDLLEGGRTDRLPDRYEPGTRAAVVERPESAFRTDPYAGRRGPQLSQRELRHVLDDVASPTARDDAGTPTAPAAPLAAPAGGALPDETPAAGYRHAFEQVVVGRRRQHRVELRFAYGSITEVDARAIALGVFRDVAPAGPALALDRRLDGAITELARRRMFSRRVGEIFVMPTGRHPIAADLITFVGLGAFDRMDDTVLQTAAENVLRTFVNTRVEEFATVLFGAGSGATPADALRNLLTGFFRGLVDADRDHRFRRIVLCENDRARYVMLKEELYRLSSTALCEPVEITFDEVALPPERETAPVRGAPPPIPTPVYLIVRQQAASGAGAGRTLDVRSSLLTAGEKAAVITGVRAVRASALEAAREAVVDEGVSNFAAPGARLGELLLADEVRAVLPRYRDRHLVVVHDAPMSRVPWEAVPFTAAGSREPWFPAAAAGLSRRYEADNLSVAKWLAARTTSTGLRVLLVVNPTGDLPGAESEGKRLRELFQDIGGVQLDQLRGDEATRPALLSAFNSGRYDVVHYAGHAFFDEDNPERSGVLCHNQVALSGADLAGLANLPTLVFLNACESARLRKVETRVERAGRVPKTTAEQLASTVGLAEAFLRGGIANFIGTYWPVGDDAALAFGGRFYRDVLRGAPIGAALQTARQAVQTIPSRDWADYIFYGDPQFVLKVSGG